MLFALAAAPEDTEGGLEGLVGLEAAGVVGGQEVERPLVVADAELGLVGLAGRVGGLEVEGRGALGELGGEGKPDAAAPEGRPAPRDKAAPAKDATAAPTAAPPRASPVIAARC